MYRIEVAPKLERQVIEVAREFRKNATRGEQLLWQELRSGKIGFRVRRQQPIGPFVVDFYVPRSKLIIKVDGPIHELQIEHDQARERLLKQCGFTVLRIPDELVCTNPLGAAEQIRQATSALKVEADGP